MTLEFYNELVAAGVLSTNAKVIEANFPNTQTFIDDLLSIAEWIDHQDPNEPPNRTAGSPWQEVYDTMVRELTDDPRAGVADAFSKAFSSFPGDLGDDLAAAAAS